MQDCHSLRRRSLSTEVSSLEYGEKRLYAKHIDRAVAFLAAKASNEEIVKATSGGGAFEGPCRHPAAGLWRRALEDRRAPRLARRMSPE